MNTPNESTDPLRPAYPDPAGSGGTDVTGKRKRGPQRNIAVLVILALVVLLAIFFLGREEGTPDDVPAPVPTTVE